MHNIGMLISLPIMGYASDRYGRRAALITSGVGAGVLGLCKSFVTSYHAYLLAELLETVLGASVYPSAFVLSEYPIHLRLKDVNSGRWE